MCIRDSAQIKAIALLGIDAYAIHDNCHYQECDFSAITSGPCLLYTSDAADERSSVDLGGRRIIKKQNTYQISGGRTSYKNTNEREKHSLQIRQRNE